MWQGSLRQYAQDNHLPELPNDFSNTQSRGYYEIASQLNPNYGNVAEYNLTLEKLNDYVLTQEKANIANSPQRWQAYVNQDSWNALKFERNLAINGGLAGLGTFVPLVNLGLSGKGAYDGVQDVRQGNYVQGTIGLASSLIGLRGFGQQVRSAVKPTDVLWSNPLGPKMAPKVESSEGAGGSVLNDASSFGPARPGLEIPQGLSGTQYDRISGRVRAAANSMGLGDDIFVMGSRAGGTAKVGSDLDIGIRVTQEQFDDLIASSFANAKNARAATMEVAIRDGRIQAGEAGLSRLGRLVAGDLNFPTNKVQISVIRAGGVFDNGPQSALSYTFGR